jgi:hypothetical protein
MQKNVTKTEEKNVLEWLKGNITMADMSRIIGVDPRSTKPYVRITKTIKKLYMDRTIVILKQ